MMFIQKIRMQIIGYLFFFCILKLAVDEFPGPEYILCFNSWRLQHGYLALFSYIALLVENLF